MEDLAQLQAALDAIPDPVEASDGGDGGDASDASDASDAEAATPRYRVQSGDSLESLAAAHDTTPDAILAANVGTLINDNLIVGQFIQLPGYQEG